MLHCYTRKNAQLVTNLQQTCSKSVATTCWQDVLALVVPSLLTRLLQACSRLATSLMNPTALLQVCSNNLLSGLQLNQQLVNKLWVTNLVQLDKITALLQTCWQACYKLVDKLVTSLLRAQLVDKLCVFACVRGDQLVTWLQFIAAEQSPHGSVFRAIYVLLSVHIRGLIKIFWYFCKVRGQVRAGQQNFVRKSTKFCPEVVFVLPWLPCWLALAVEIECRRLFSNLFGYVLIVIL